MLKRTTVALVAATLIATPAAAERPVAPASARGTAVAQGAVGVGAAAGGSKLPVYILAVIAAGGSGYVVSRIVRKDRRRSVSPR
jgi:hypothetical protein